MTTNQSTPRFVKLDEANNDLPIEAKEWAYVRDNKTGLIWTASAMASRMNWKDALAAPASLGSGWRLPTIEELETLRDRSRFQPAADPALNLKSDWYWSSTPDASSPSDCAWFVDFSGGGSYWGGQNNRGLVRPVRSVSA